MQYEQIRFRTISALGGVALLAAASLPAFASTNSASAVELDDQVLVAFEHGTTRHPVILGTLWSGDDAPPETSSKDSTGAMTTTTPGGGPHVRVFNGGVSGERTALPAVQNVLPAIQNFLPAVQKFLPAIQKVLQTGP